MKQGIIAALAAAVLAASGLGAQEPASAEARARATLPPDVFEGVSALVVEARGFDVPAEPLYAKALEGAAKRVPPERIVPAVREYATRLRDARAALGPDADDPLLVAAADALRRGVPRDAIRSLPPRGRRPMAMLALAELLESGVPADRAVNVLGEVMEQAREDRVLDLSARVRRLIRQGVAPRDALERVRRTLARERGRIGPPVPPGSVPGVRDRIRDRVR